MVLSRIQYLGCGSSYWHCHCHGMRGLPWTTELLSGRSGSAGDADPAPEAAPPRAVVFPSGGLLLEGRRGPDDPCSFCNQKPSYFSFVMEGPWRKRSPSSVVPLAHLSLLL